MIGKILCALDIHTCRQVYSDTQLIANQITTNRKYQCTREGCRYFHWVKTVNGDIQ